MGVQLKSGAIQRKNNTAPGISSREIVPNRPITGLREEAKRRDWDTNAGIQEPGQSIVGTGTVANQIATINDNLAILATVSNNYGNQFVITTSQTIVKPSKSTVFQVDSTGGAITVTLYPATGDSTDLLFVLMAGTNHVTFALSGGDTCPLPLTSATITTTGGTQSFMEILTHVWIAH